MNPGLIICLAIWTSGLLALIAILRSGLCRQSQSSIVKTMLPETLRQLDLQCGDGHLCEVEPFKEAPNIESAPPGTPVIPNWCYSLWPSVVEAIALVALIMAAPFAILFTSLGLQRTLWAQADPYFIPIHPGWSVLPGFFLFFGFLGISYKILLLRFPLFEAYGVIWREVAFYVSKLPPEQRNQNKNVCWIRDGEITPRRQSLMTSGVQSSS